MSWADDFSLQNSTANQLGKPVVKKSPTRKEQLEAELKLLEWHKLANDAAIKAAIMQTKQLKREIPPRPPTHTAEDSKWMRRVIETENVKPLEVTKDFVLEYEAKEKENAERLSSQVDRHISTLSNLRKKLEDRNAMKSRTDEYRAWKKDFSIKKQAVMIGKTLDEIEMFSAQDDSAYESVKKSTFNPTLKNGPSQELSNVLDSLSKLAELEKRITSLERDNEYDVLANRDKPSANNRTSFEFRKKRTPLEEGAAVGISFALRQKKAEPAGRRAVPTGNAIAAVRAKQNGRTGGGVFLTNMGDDDDGRYEDEQNSFEDRAAALKREKAKALAMSSAGKQAIRGRVVAKKDRAKETMLGAQKHELALKELNKRRHEQLNKKKATRPVGVQIAAKGISAGVKNKNKHLQDFEKIKSGHRKRKDDISRKFKLNDGGRGLASGAVDVSNGRIASYSAPQKGRVPAVKSGGTTTRRVENPVRRGGGNGAMTAPLPGAITGIRAIKQLRK